MLLQLIYFIDSFFLKHVSCFSEHTIFSCSENTEIFFRFITKFGEGYFELLLIAIMVSFLLFNKEKSCNLKKYIVGVLLTLLSTQVAVNLLKFSFGRARPSITVSPDKFYGLIKNSSFFETDYASFPSGHTITVWGTIWILSFLLIKNRHIKILLFVLGFLVGVSRVYLVYHWTTDVIASIVISYFIAKIVYNRMKLNDIKLARQKKTVYDMETEKFKRSLDNRK
ncbi:phosphatase PAP2 family protein [Leptotrichia sp. oral taxon 212]|uniref:phosphatase PAP2 family protein n=1 Tax=Leptotrichia sp. oral taxon 212 TaxID=712357 RepID=UPI0006A98B38|nr:phosphatase PAP2 family protein [Leptotrichia sp. oral taxon 212]ALA95989.1 PA-phosphatase [Leptotrichia sp. oral taxon 212]